MFYMYYNSNKRIRSKRSLALFLSIVISVIIVFEVFFELVAYPAVCVYVENVLHLKLQTAMNKAAAEYLEANEIEYSDLVFLSQNADGYVTSLQVNSSELNIAKAGIAKLASGYISKDEMITVYIPVGSLLGSTAFSGIGPQIPFSIKTSSTFLVSFESEFTESGINQTLHKININVECRSAYILPLHKKSFSTKTDYIMAQSVIVGKVPENYTEVIEFGDTTDNTVPNIFDYGTGN